MESQAECFVSGAVATILWLSRLAGLAPLRFRKKGNGWLISYWPKLAAICYICIAMYCLIFISRILINVLQGFKTGISSLDGSVVQIHNAVWLVDDVTSTILALTVIVKAPALMRSLIQCFNKIKQLNSLLNICHWSTLWTKKMIISFLVWGIVIFILFVLDIIIFMEIFDDTPIWYKVVYYISYYANWSSVTFKMQFLIVVIHVRTSFIAINDDLRNLSQVNNDQGLESPSVGDIQFSFPSKKVNNYIITKQDSKFNSGTKCNLPQESVRRLSTAYMIACDVVRELDLAFGLPILILLASLFMHNVLLYYYCIVNLKMTSFEKIGGLYAEIQLICWALLNTFHVVIIIEPCHLTHMEVETTRELVSEMLRQQRFARHPLAVELDKFYKYLQLNDVSYSPLQVVKMTRGFLLTIFANVTTYLVILVQFKSSG